MTLTLLGIVKATCTVRGVFYYNSCCHYRSCQYGSPWHAAMVPSRKRSPSCSTRKPQRLMWLDWSRRRPNPSHLFLWCYDCYYRRCLGWHRRSLRQGTGPFHF